MKRIQLAFILILLHLTPIAQEIWQSELVFLSPGGKLVYAPDMEGNTIPDFSRVGYASGEKEIPFIPAVEILEALPGDNRKRIQQAIDRIAARPPDANGFRGALLLKKGTYDVEGSLVISHSGIVIRGEGAGKEGTVIRETAREKINLFRFEGSGNPEPELNTVTFISEDLVPAGRNYLEMTSVAPFRVGDSVMLCRQASDAWIHDLKMDRIEERPGTKQWTAAEYTLNFERIVTAIQGNRIYLNNPVMMPLEKRYGGAYLMKYTFMGRISHCGIENLLMESSYRHDTDEDHGWDAISFRKVSQSWARNVVSRYFGNGCVNIGPFSRNISVLDSQCHDARSVITGGRRYSFNCNGQMNLFRNCHATEGRHDFVTGSRVLGPNVFTRCTARNTHSDIGPHHRWSVGTLYDMIDTDGEINIQDRGNYGSGHGWAGVTQVLWNCRSPKTAVQSPWVSGKNYSIGLIGGKYGGRFPERPDGVWEGLNRPGLAPESLYDLQLKARMANQ